MNKQMFLDVADAIKDEEVAFSMTHFGPARGGLDLCGTTACVCGWTNWIVRDERTPVDFGDETAAAEALGISKSQADRLFFPTSGSIWAEIASEYGWASGLYGLNIWSEIKAHQAADVLRRIANGELTL